MGAMTSLASIGLNAALSRQAQRTQEKALKKDQERQLQAIAMRDAELKRQQEQTLRRRIAEERARAGASGVGSSGGSADAIVRGLVEESRLASAARAGDSGLRTAEINDSYALRRRQNLLNYTSRMLSLGRTGTATSRSLLD